MESSKAATLIRGATVVDGTGAPGRVGDLLLANGRIAAVGVVDEKTLPREVEEIDASGLVAAPGFVDVHTHDDAAALDDPDMLPKLSQGVTTVIVGNCGISLAPVVTGQPPAPLSLLGNRQFRHASLAQYARAVDAASPAVNVAALMGHTALRVKHVKDLQRAATAEERAVMAADLQEAMQAGALGLSSGVFYREAFAADFDELVALAKVSAAGGGIYVTHIRDEMADILPAMMEAAGTAKRAGLPLVLSHHKCAGPANWGRTRETLPLVDELAQAQPIALDVYPYTAGSTVLRDDLVDGVIDVLITGSEPHPEMAGRWIADIARQWGVTQQEAARRLQPGGACYFQMREDDVERVIAHPLAMIGSDGLPNDERPHPRLWGAFPRVLACYWREKGLLQLEQAIHKMTGMSARRFGIARRGELREDYAADVVLFDPKRVRDVATFEQPQALSEGIERVWVNGAGSYRAGEGVTARAGRFVRRAVA
jgi:N-acyl-D-amino-acid deacylase